MMTKTVAVFTAMNETASPLMCGSVAVFTISGHMNYVQERKMIQLISCVSSVWDEALP